MRLSSARRLLATLPLLAHVVHAQDSNYTTGLVNALNGAGLTALGAAVGAAPPALLSALQQGNHTVFAPSNAALSGIDPSALGDIANILAYHVTAGVVDTGALNENATIVRTSLASEPAVHLPGNQSQVLVISKAQNGTILIDNTGRTVQTSANATYQNLHVFVIDRVLQIPGNLSFALSTLPDVSALAGAVQGALPDLIPTLTRTRGLTLFAPINSAIQAVSEQLPQLNETTLTNVLLNHIINGTAVYSPQITGNSGLNLTSVGGSGTTFVSNSSGIFVTSGPATARIVRANVLTSNGVVHLIDRVLLNTASNPAQASDAAISYVSVQASQTASQTGPVTASPGSNGAVAATGIAQQLYVAVGAVVMGALLGAHLL